MLPSSHDLVTAILVYLAIGASIWMVIYSKGFVHAALRSRSLLAVSFASVAVILFWPSIVAVAFRASFARRPRR